MAGLSLVDVNALDEDAFVRAFGAVYEANPHLAAEAGRQRPFADCATLVAAFAAAAARLDEAGELALLRAHPQLASTGPMAAASIDEQRAAGLPDADEATHARIAAGNAAYLERFGFPFIIAVRGLQPSDIATALEARLGQDPERERVTALAQVNRIAELRIRELVAS